MPGPSDTVIILAVALLLFGPAKLPDIGKTVGKALRELHKVRDEFLNGISLDDDDKTRR